MKGFVGGVPVALLAAAALAQAQEGIRGPAQVNGASNVRRHHVEYVPSGNTVIGGPSGSDSGNSASIDFESEFSSKVNDAQVDDHGVDVDKTTDYHPHPVHNEVEEGFSDPFPEPLLAPIPLAMKKRQEGNTAIGGTSGSDVGNAADLSFDSEFDSEVNDGIIPIHYRRHARRQGDSVIGGPGGSDSGNSASYDSENEFESEVNDSETEVESKVDDAYKDDHHIDYDELNDIHPHPVYNEEVAPALVPKPFGESLFVKRKDDKDFGLNTDSDSDSDDEHHTVPFKKGNTVIGGPGGSDTGNDAAFDFESSFDSKVDDTFHDDHHIDYNEANHIHPHPVHNDFESHHVPEPFSGHFFVKRQGNSAIGGPGGSDSGSDVDYSSEHELESEVHDAHKDDHHVDASVVNDIGGGGVYNHQTFPHHVSGPVPVPYNIPGPESFDGPQRPAVAHDPQVPAAVPGPEMQASAHAPRSEASVHGPASGNVPPCSTVVHEVVHTVTQTLPSRPTMAPMGMFSAVPMAPFGHHAPASSGGADFGAMKDFFGSQYAPSPSSSAAAHMYAVPTGAMPYAPTHAVQHPASTVTIHKTGSSVVHMHALPTGAASGVATNAAAQYPASAATLHRTPSSVAHMMNAVPIAATHPAQQPSSTLTLQKTSSSAHMHAMPTGAMPVGATHPAQQPASTLTVQAASTFVAIPVYVPGASSAASPSGAAPVQTSHSSAAKASQSAPASSTPAKHHGMMFTGGAASFSPNTALVSVFCGAVALLAYAL
ncbi:putative GPI anchored protein [Aspergillus candidus]|uniref:GPI anchored protein n=1 Tax=Aspergillus candidus TaxID=41067 RepID=A0A2I2FB98_ASPCN|nr:hypothetical protein BDW47DRAFT_106022 [Aspergillus candidus]PLB37902.1 hypothetical protein BDW47DRAFT_106022 [Aspergillus candidus]